MTDPRVRHFWDDEDAAGCWFVAHLPTYAGREWDVYLLFGPDAEWRAIPLPLLGSGSTVIEESDDLARAAGPLLGSGSPASVPATSVG